MKGCLLGLFYLFVSIQSFAQTLEDDRLALVAFYQAAGGDNWYDKTGWVVPGNVGDNPCGWFGVTCEGGRVTSLILEQNDGFGEIPAAVGGLTALKHLDLSGAGDEFPQFRGNLPAELGNLTNLEYLDISENMILGPNIQVIGNLTKLKHLSITPYWSVPASFANLTNLEYLRMAADDYPFPTATNLGAIPAFFGTFTKLKTLILRNANATGPIPSSFSSLANLEVLDLSNNALVGTIPGATNFTKLTKMDLSNNELESMIPDLSAIPVSANVNIANNKFTFSGMEGNVPFIDTYSPQKDINVAMGFPTADLYAIAGGVVANNTYKWYFEGQLVFTGVGVDHYRITKDGLYKVEVTNALVPGLTLKGEIDATILPVTLISFEGKSETNQIKLTWKTASETNNKGFEIERSADARMFEKIGFVDGSGDTKEDQFYHFTDLNPLVTGYYRLKQLDYDGKFEYSKVIAVKASTGIIKMYPNPVQTELTVEGAAENELVSVFTPTGSLVIAGTKLSAGKLDVKGLKEGIYTIKIGDVAKKLLIKR